MRRHIACRAAAIITLIAVIGRPAHGQSIPAITLDDALRRSRLASPSVVAARGAVRGAELSTNAALWEFVPAFTFEPQANLTLSSGQSRLDPVTQEIISGNQSNPSLSFGAAATYTIFDGFARNHNLRMQRANEEAAAANLVSTAFASDVSTTNAYFSALTNVHVLGVAQGNLEAAESQLRLASAKLHSGAGRITDSLTALGAYQQATLAVLSAQSDVVVGESALGRLVGVSGLVTAVDDPAFSQAPPALDTATIRQRALTEGPSVRSLAASLIAQKQAYSVAKSGYLPTLAVSAAESWTADDGSNYSFVARRSLNLQLSFSPWTSLARERSIENAAIAVTNAEAALADQRNALFASLNQLYSSLAVAQSAITVSEGGVATDSLNLRLVTEQYRNGVSNISEVVTATQQLVTAQAAAVSARYSYFLAKAQLEALVGRKL